MIGEPVGAAVHWSAPGHERWHPAPGFYYQPGGGPLFDMGPYYLTSLVTCSGPVARVSGVREPLVPRARRSRPARAPAPCPGRRRHARHRAARARESGVLVDGHHELRGVGHAGAAVRGLRRRARSPCPTRTCSRTPVSVVHRRHRASGTRCRNRAGYRNAGRGFGLADMAAAIAAGHRTAHPASSPSTFSRSWSRSSPPRPPARSWSCRVRSPGWRPCRCPTRRETQQEFRP